MKTPKIPLRLSRTGLAAYTLLTAFLFCCCSSSVVTKDTSFRDVGPATHPSMPAATTDTSRIAVGDSVTFSVWGYPEFSTRVIVRRSGYITVTLIGEMMAAGYTKEEFSKLLRKKLGEYIQGEIRLFVEITSPLPKIIVVGKVPRQGSFPTNIDMPLLELLSNVGGWTEESDLRHVRISRRRTQESEGGTIEVDVESHLESGDFQSLPFVSPGDVVYVPSKENAVRQTAEYLRDAFLLFGFFRLFD
jgi:polysaccharide export outer membrane protein